MNKNNNYDIDFIASHDIDGLIAKIRSQSSIVALFGACSLAKYALNALKSRGIHVSYVCDSDEQKRGEVFCDYEIVTLSDLANDRPDAYVFICSLSVAPMLSNLESFGFVNVFSCTPLFNETDFSDLGGNYEGSQPEHKVESRLLQNKLAIGREIGAYKAQWMKFVSNKSQELKLKSIDIVITEKCSMKCIDCSNLMQYYERPQNSDLIVLFESLDKIMKGIDWIYEFRVLGGEPFVNKDIHKVINQLLLYENVGEVIIYTNATITPKNENLSCLKNKRVLVDITNYGSLSRNYEKLIKVFDSEGISYTSKIPKWTDSGRILPHQGKTERELKEMFSGCCVNDSLTLLNGKLYRCPFSANATNINAIPYDSNDVIELGEEKEGDQLRQKLEQFYNDKNYLTACSYCNGRDFKTPDIVPAIQTKKRLPIPVTY